MDRGVSHMVRAPAGCWAGAVSNDTADPALGSTTTTDRATRAELLDVLRDQAATTEQAGRPTHDTLTALRALGALALRTPRAHGGAGADTTTVARRLTEVGRACPTSAWVAGTCLTAKNIAATVLPEAAAAEVFADPDTLFCGSGFPGGRGERVPGGVRVTGSWPNVSGCEDAVWASLGVLVDGALTFVVVPVDALTVERTWDVAGMRGTGSHTLVARDLVVPDGRTGRAAPFGPADQLLYVVAVLAPVVGAAQGALDATTEMFASARKPYLTAYTRMGESPGARHWLAEASHLVHGAETSMLAVADRTDSAAAGTDDADALAGAGGHRLRLALADAARDCRAALELVLDLNGTSGFRAGSPVQRLWRDVAVGSRHPLLNPYLTTERLGEALVPPPAA
ncbi:acyl-CoA dehydrogenase [Promicromonospora citrea]|uniref:Acyl-CoA dehydrogenase n=1 Tax=Promicromonospora citrea TaxID=43677 RepID=A0A8H9GLP8_9MICO|nr:acyl-CoA dehydrogenase [Promicromonospora citrea]